MRVKGLERKRLACSLGVTGFKDATETVALQSSVSEDALLVIRRRLVAAAATQLLHQFFNGGFELAITAGQIIFR
jgi:hypothetical protein